MADPVTYDAAVSQLLSGSLAGKTVTAYLIREDGWVIDLKGGDTSVLTFQVTPPDLYPLFYRVFPEACVTLDQEPVREPNSIIGWFRPRIGRHLIGQEQWDNDSYWVIGAFFCKAE
jgi:hypothetical protein